MRGVALVVLSVTSVVACGDDSDVEARSETSGQEETVSGETTTTTTVGASGRGESPSGGTATSGDVLEEGVAYEYALYIHCGMDVLGMFNDQWWFLREASVDTSDFGFGGEMPDHWGVDLNSQELHGVIELVGPERIELSLPDGEVIGVYASDDREPPGCD